MGPELVPAEGQRFTACPVKRSAVQQGRIVPFGVWLFACEHRDARSRFLLTTVLRLVGLGFLENVPG